MVSPFLSHKVDWQTNTALEVSDPIASPGAISGTTEPGRHRKLAEAHEFAETIIAAIPDILFEMDRNGRYLQIWTKHPELLAATKQQLLGKTVNDVLPPEDAAAALRAVREADEKGVSDCHVIRIVQQDGEPRWFEHHVAKKAGSETSSQTFLVLSRDVTERKLAEHILDEARTRLLTVLQTIPDMVWMKDMDGAYLLCNHAFEHLVGKSESEIIGKTDLDLFDTDVARVLRERELAIDAGGAVINERWVIHQGSGQRILLEIRKVPIIGAEGKTTGVLGVARDITELNASREKIHRMAFYDSLTDLPNRELFYERLRQAMADAHSHRQLVGVMMMDIDHFKAVNDTMGHPVGDELLCQAARRFQASVRTADTVARLSGDEFAILLPSIRHANDLADIAAEMLKTFDEPFLLDGKEVFVSCSIGIAFHPDHSADANDLVKYADSAMYLAKRLGRGGFQFYSRQLTEDAQHRLMLESELRRAIERGELEVYYQPKVLVENGMMVGSEALLRWHHGKMGMVPPAQFIPIAEDTGLIADLGRWVFREACRTAAQLNADGSVPHKVAINFSSRQFQRSDLVQMVTEILDETACHAEWIEIEITESLLLDQQYETLATLCALRTKGISIAIDDFGTGYSALNYLARFPIDTLKIDRSFISSDDKRSAELVKAILSIARCLGQSVVAEGVETVEQAAFLRASGCDAAQGFLYSKPLPKAEFVKLPQFLSI
ncbi:putative bifunctional diguanylate cyclase/phosphodiesterase [Rhizobium leucaenae]|uniref:Diguanylate cyclase (GGDEF)-like protein/PAS domain S-box-containing protein n=1 Tax=Rhizobium leucaenae TaxID=29450 RepID=A0A7W6ZYV3_9HYPH|nr:bifunctional diguanylate cyclase/phosphodiesterase [Rhizobium leucaenae]MBB4570762.1 diguanylate cyclase (GGDEF)-like protein/PAS domain S-box-containing protein [Rhizobium leucaenae]